MKVQQQKYCFGLAIMTILSLERSIELCIIMGILMLFYNMTVLRFCSHDDVY